MSTTIEKFVPLQRYVFHNIDWDGYQKILEAAGDHRLRHTFDDGVLEIMSPSNNHERYKKIIARLLEMMTFELDIPLQGLGNLTMSPISHDKGIEPDECYFLNNRIGNRKGNWDARVDPAPDLAIEIVVSNPYKARLPIFAKLGIAEIWSYDGDELKFLALQKSGQYLPIERSSLFPFLESKALLPFIELIDDEEDNVILRKFVDWIRTLSIN